MKGKARCYAKKPAESCGQVAGTGTLRYLHRLVRAALQDAVDEELLARNVARQVKMPGGSIRKVTPWSAEEARRFLETARHDRLYALWAVALAIGLRRGEALGLRWVDVDLVSGRVVIAKALLRVGGEPSLAGRENRIVCCLCAAAGGARCDLAAASTQSVRRHTGRTGQHARTGIHDQERDTS
jgi:integrase